MAAKGQKFLSVMADPQFPNGEVRHSFVNPDAPQKGELILGALGTFDTFYPFFHQGHAAEGIGLLWATLFQRAEDEIGISYPYLAESADVEEGKVTFHLRSTAVFSDQSPVLPEDVLYTYHFLKEHHFPLPGYYAFVERAEKTGQRSVTFFLRKEAPAEAASVLGDLPVFSKKSLHNNRVDKHPLTPPLGNGPYRLSSAIQGRCVVYEKVKKWWGDTLPIHRGTYNFQKIRYEYFRDPSVLFEAFKGGQIDVFTEITSKNWAHNYDFKAVKEGKIIKEVIPHKHPALHPCLLFNTRKPLFSKQPLRRALSLLLDFEALNTLLFEGSYQRVRSFFQNTPFAAEARPSSEEKKILEELGASKEVIDFPIEHWTEFKGNPRSRRKEALTLLRKEGWRPHRGILKKEGKPFFFTLLLPSPFLTKALQPFVQDLRRCGIEMHIRVVNPAEYMVALKNFDFDMIYGSLSTTGEMPGNELLDSISSGNWNTYGTHNLAGIHHPVIDQLIQRILASQTFSQMQTYAHALDRVILRECYGIPAWTYSGTRIAYWNRLAHPSSVSRSGVNVHNWWEIKPRQP